VPCLVLCLGCVPWLQALTLKYHTSKLSAFSDLLSVHTFGFRGEALSSLCALADVSICTRTKDEPVAARLVYDHSGRCVPCMGGGGGVGAQGQGMPETLRGFFWGSQYKLC